MFPLRLVAVVVGHGNSPCYFPVMLAKRTKLGAIGFR
jgi:hypothetical protein